MCDVIGGFLERCGLAAQAAGRHFAGIDVATMALRRLAACDGGQRVLQALRMLEKVDLSVLDHGRQRPGPPVSTFDVEAARRACETLLAEREMRGRAVAGVLMWIVESTIDDPVSGFSIARDVLSRCGLTSEYMAEAESRRRAAAPIGAPIDAEGEILDADDVRGHRFHGRWQELVSHRSELRRALIRGEHYFLVGGRGVGKTTFAKRLVEQTLRAFLEEDDPRLTDTRFLWCGKADLLGSASQTQERFSKVAEAIEEGFTPVIDDLDVVLAPEVPGGQEAMRTLGHEFIAPSRGFVLIAEREAADKLPFPNQYRRRVLPAPSHGVMQRIAADYLRFAAGADGTLVLDGTPEALGGHACRVARDNYADRSAPQSVLRLIDGAMELTAVGGPRNDGGPQFDVDAMLTFVARDLNAPREMIERDGRKLRDRLKRELLGSVVAQDCAVVTVAEWVAFGDRLSVGQTPRARFLFVGPPGVGKTHLARSLAEALGYDQEALVMLNMSEYATESARTRFMGSDPGYVGYGQTRTVYDIVRARPSCIILLDEIDRAHPSIQDILLSILEGQGADASGRPVYFSQSIILATTNLGQEQIEAAARQGSEGGRTRDQVAETLDDGSLRELMLKGAVDQSERNMQDSLDQRILATRVAFDAVSAEEDGREALIDTYIGLCRRRDALRLTRRHVALDRAFLDRIDVVVPFLPISTEADVRAVLDVKLKQVGWQDCPEPVRAGIMREVAAAGGSVRRIDRCVRQRLLARFRSDPAAPA